MHLESILNTRPNTTDTIYNSGVTSFPLPHEFKVMPTLQFHYGLGFGVRFNRAWMMIPTIHEIPLIGIHEWNLEVLGNGIGFLLNIGQFFSN